MEAATQKRVEAGVGRGRAGVSLVAALALSFSPALIGALFGPGMWYQQLDKPAWTPPNWIFGPAWTILYALMGIAVWLVWLRPGSPAQRAALIAFVVQLALNALWTPAFFGMQSPGLGLIVIVLLWFAIVATIVLFWRVRRIAAVILILYIAWVTYAAALNAAIWQMN